MCLQNDEKRNNISLSVNKTKTELPEGSTVMALLEARGAAARTSVWINGYQLLIAEYPTWVLREGDEVKILRVVAGG